MKKIILSAGLFLLLSTIFSCKKFLEEKLTTDPTDAFYTSSAAGFENGMNTLYAYLRNIYPRNPESYWGEGPSSLSVFGTDTYTNGSDGDYKGFNQYDTRLNASVDILSWYWQDSYQAINQANAMIALAADPIPGLSSATVNQRVAEARFIRALMYFNIVRIWGPVTLTLEPTVGVQTAATRTSEKEIFDNAIIPDLQFAVDNLPDKQSQYGRATKPAAQMLMGRVLLTRGYSDYAEAKDFSDAASLFDHVINDYGFKLLDKYSDVFDIDNQKNDEVIWSVQYTKDLILDGHGNNMHCFFQMEYDVLPGMKRDIENGRPIKRFRPTQFLLGLWDRNDDVRYDVNFKKVFYCNNPATAPAGVSLGDTAIYLPGFEVTPAFRASKPYMIIAPSDYTEKLYPTLTKFLDPTRVTVNQTEGQRDWMVMRLADTYLLAAEAYFQAGDLPTAAERINAIRKRAAKPGKEAEMEITASDVTIDFILDERARELVGEFHRWFALKRTGKLLERVKAHNPQAAPNIQSYHLLRPIPQTQIDRVPGGYEQNPGY